MTIYVLRHAIAVARGGTEYPGDDRPLTPRGISRMKRNAAGILILGLEFEAILHSPLSRSRDTARIVAKAVDPRSPLIETDALLPGADPADILRELRAMKAASVLLVGHEPHLGLLAARILGTAHPPLLLRKGGLAKFDDGTAPPGTARLGWVLTPRQLRIIGARG